MTDNDMLLHAIATESVSVGTLCKWVGGWVHECVVTNEWQVICDSCHH